MGNFYKFLQPEIQKTPQIKAFQVCNKDKIFFLTLFLIVFKKPEVATMIKKS